MSAKSKSSNRYDGSQIGAEIVPDRTKIHELLLAFLRLYTPIGPLN
jgi:hypothetical protein